MNEELSYRISVTMIDGSKREFLASKSYDYDGMTDGRVLYWKDVLINNQRYEFYSIPVHQISEVFETEL